MSNITSCYANWRIDLILIVGIIAFLLVSDGSEELLARLIGLLVLVLDFFIARRWRKDGKLPELDKITE